MLLEWMAKFVQKKNGRQSSHIYINNNPFTSKKKNAYEYNPNLPPLRQVVILAFLAHAMVNQETVGMINQK
jgi:hypothetical protein